MSFLHVWTYFERHQTWQNKNEISTHFGPLKFLISNCLCFSNHCCATKNGHLWKLKYSWSEDWYGAVMCFRLIKSDQSPAVHNQKLCHFMAICMKSIAINNYSVSFFDFSSFLPRRVDSQNCLYFAVWVKKRRNRKDSRCRLY